MSTTKSFEAFKDCLGPAAQQQLDDLLAGWSRNLNLDISSPAASYVSDLMKDEQALAQLICLNSFLDQEIAAVQGGFNGLLSFVDACLEQAFSREGYRLRVALSDALGDSQAARDALQVPALQARLAQVQAQRAHLQAQADLALDVIDATTANPPLLMALSLPNPRQGQAHLYATGQSITLLVEGNLALEALEVTVPRVDLPDPRFDAVPESAIERIGPQAFRVTAEIPADYRGDRFAVKFFAMATRRDTATFFAKFERAAGAAQPRGRFVYRPCPPN